MSFLTQTRSPLEDSQPQWRTTAPLRAASRVTSSKTPFHQSLPETGSDLIFFRLVQFMERHAGSFVKCDHRLTAGFCAIFQPIRDERTGRRRVFLELSAGLLKGRGHISDRVGVKFNQAGSPDARCLFNFSYKLPTSIYNRSTMIADKLIIVTQPDNGLLRFGPAIRTGHLDLESAWHRNDLHGVLAAV